ncbi:MAG: hypothetical protein U1E65_19315 [Myxococcota bacterium]
MNNRAASKPTVASPRTFRALAVSGVFMGVLSAFGASSFGAAVVKHVAVVSADPEAADVESIDVDLTVVDFAPTLITVER